ncbi:MAG: dehydrogenase [Anaerolineae bacterium]|nr:dehydrogenase [Anaerolineae bacterium]
MRTFRVALTGDFCDAAGSSAYGDIGLGLLQSAPYIQYHFLQSLMPNPADPGYFDRLYSLLVTPEHIADIDGLIVLRPWVKDSTFANGAENLTVIGRSGAGYDKINLKACTENDVAVFNVPDALNHSTASSALMFMLMLAKRVIEQDRITREARWDLQPSVMGMELEGRTLGIVGLGASGRELVRLVAPFNMQVIAYSPSADPAQAEALGVRLTTLDEVMRESDFVSIHSRLTPDKKKMIGAAQLALMKPSAYLINIARGELIDQHALVKVLQERRIAGAGLDVFAVEPLPADDPLLKLDNVILTPHWSPATTDIWIKTGRGTCGGMVRAARGEVPDNIVNPEVLDRPGFQTKLARFVENRS